MKQNCLTESTLKCVNKDFRNYYRKVTRGKPKIRYDNYEYDNDKIIQLFLKKVADKLVENRAGVHINRIGYFFIYRHPFVFPPRKIPHLRTYMPTFIPTDGSIFKYWSMDFKFNRSLDDRIQKEVRKGQRYLNMMLGLPTKNTMYIGASNGALMNKNKI